MARRNNELSPLEVVVENNNIGFSVLEKLLTLEYPNVYHSIKSTHEYVEQYAAIELRTGTFAH